MAISAEDRARISEAIRAAEQNTSGEIVCVLARSSSEYTAAPVLVGALLALVLPWAFVLLTQWSVQRILVVQLIIFVLATSICALTPLGMVLVPRRIKRVRAHRAAMEQFHSRGLGRLESRAGVLIYVSLAERYARIVVDDHLAAKIHASEWRAPVDALTAHMKDGRIADGFVAAIARCGAVLAEHAPGAHTRKLPDRIYVI
ncbi:MAG: putative rane protein [Methylobacteriaceae bacterium]|jgi:putative membrane protein|nr:putative rane protein [Methylobacteriaceae bacterium]